MNTLKFLPRVRRMCSAVLVTSPALSLMPTMLGMSASRATVSGLMGMWVLGELS